MDKWHQSQRGYFAGALLEQMRIDQDIFLLTGDLGFGAFDKIRDEFPDRYINCGASEQAMAGIAVGLALKGRKPFVYSITPFLLRRAYETLKLYVDEEQVAVRLIGGGRDKDYAHDGASHDATSAKELLSTLPGIVQYWPESKEEVPAMVKQLALFDKPAFISLKR